MVLQVPENKTAAEGLRMLETARRKHRSADALEQAHPLVAKEDRLEAQAAEHIAAAILNLSGTREIGAGGELRLSEDDAFDAPGLVNTVNDPTLVTVEASRARLDLASEADCLSLAIDAAETIQAANSIEKMLAHQVAAAHAMGMRLAAKAELLMGHIESWNSKSRVQVQAVEACRLSGAAARMFRASQEGMVALQKIRSGGKQVVVVQYQQVNVADGGQAVVAGKLGRSRRGLRQGEAE